MKIFLIGNITLDVIIKSLSEPLVWGTEVFIDSITHRSGGNLLNTAFPLKKLGLESNIIGNVGDDIYGKEIIEDIKKYKLPYDLIKIERNKTTSISYSLIRGDGERFLITYPGQLLLITKKFIENYLPEIKKGSIVFLSSIFQLPNLTIKDITEIFKILKNIDCITVIDPGWDPKGWNNDTVSNIRDLLKYTDYFLPNLEEAKSISKCENIRRILQEFRKAGSKNVIIKRGIKDSAALIDGKIIYSPVLPTKSLDCTGAGDAFNAGVIYCINAGVEGKKMLAVSNAVSSYVISRINNRFPDIDSIKIKIS